MLLAVVVAVVANFLGTPETLKQILKDSGAYDNVVDIVLDETTRQAKDDNSIPISDEQIRTLVNDVFPAERLQAIVDNVADGTYRWLNGEAPQPDFKIDLREEKIALAKGVANYAAERIEKLPPCTSIPTTTDPFEIDCQPPGINIKAEQKKIEQEFLNNKDFLPETTLTADDLNKKSDQTFSEQNQGIADAFQLFKKLPYIFGGLAAIFGVAIIFLDKTKRDGLNRIGRTLLSSGIFLFITTLVFGKLLPITENLLNATDENASSVILKKAVGLAVEKLTNDLLLYSGVVLVIGAIILLTLHLTKPKSNHARK